MVLYRQVPVLARLTLAVFVTVAAALLALLVADARLAGLHRLLVRRQSLGAGATPRVKVAGAAQSTSAAAREPRDGAGAGTRDALPARATETTGASAVAVPAAGSVAAVAAAPPPPRDVAGYDFADTAIVTVLYAHEHRIDVRSVVALVQSLRDVRTRAQDVVVLVTSPVTRHLELLRTDRRDVDPARAHVALLDVLRSPPLSATVVLLTDPPPETQWTRPQYHTSRSMWPQRLDGLRVFNMTRYKKLLLLDSDSLVLRNIDHLFLEPMLTAAYHVLPCSLAPAALFGSGLWVVEPSARIAQELWQLQLDGKPRVNELTGGLVMAADGAPERDTWWGEWGIVAGRFSQRIPSPESRWHYSGPTPPAAGREFGWPRVDDVRHGHAPGIKYFVHLRDDPAGLAAATADAATGEALPEGLLPGAVVGDEPIWRALDARYDVAVGNCECLPERDLPDDAFTVEFSSVGDGGDGRPGVFRGPRGYAGEVDTEFEFMRDLNATALSCTRHYVLQWYARLVRAGGRLPPPLWEGDPAPAWSEEHDAAVRAARSAW